MEAALIGYLHGYIHDSFHLTGHWLERFKHFSHLRALHFRHHFNMKINFGIFWFGWDRVFKTFKNVQDPVGCSQDPN